MTETIKGIKALINRSLPEPVLNSLDLTVMEFDDTQYLDDRFNRSYSERVVKTRMKKHPDSEDGGQEYLDTDIYILFEHKSARDVEIFIQLLIYMCLMWQRDLAESKPLRVIIPIVFYHGKEDWNIPLEFKKQFKVNSVIQDYLLNFRYVLFNAKDWKLGDERKAEMENNVFLMTALSFMKNAFNDDLESVREIFRLWIETGFMKNKSKTLFAIAYIAEAKKLSQEKIIELLEESQFDGGEAMETWLDKAINEKLNEGIKRGKNERGLEIAVRMLKKGIDAGTISEVTDLSREEIEKLAETVH
ncbi:MAG: Rpn family recombination-promoting nuclease/putative transposase [bacterium]|nr:Rpn family recombination-promoting nuclease/putative transposase [bacterium]